MDLNKYRAVIFDFDGTLYDGTGFAKALVLSAPFSAFKMRAERIARRELWGRDDENQEQFEASFFKRCAFRTSARTTPKKFKEWYEKRYLKIFAKTLKKKKFRARENLAEVFSALKNAGIKIAIYSDYSNVKERMTSCKISQETLALCDGFYSSMEFGCLKPAPRGFLQIAGNLGVAPKQCLVIGDRDDTDGQGARYAGMDFVQIKTANPATDSNHEILEWNDFVKKILP